MMIKALLASIGLLSTAIPRVASRIDHGQNDAVHDLVNREAAIFAGSQAIVRRSDRLSQAMNTDPSNSSGIDKQVKGIRILSDEVARRSRGESSQIRAGLNSLARRVD